MWKYDEEFGVWWFDGYTDVYYYQKRMYEYPVSMHLEKQNMSITEAAIATTQRIDRENFQEQRWAKK